MTGFESIMAASMAMKFFGGLFSAFRKPVQPRLTEQELTAKGLREWAYNVARTSSEEREAAGDIVNKYGMMIYGKSPQTPTEEKAPDPAEDPEYYARQQGLKRP